MNNNVIEEDMEGIENEHKQELLSAEDEKLHLEKMKVEAEAYLQLVKEDKSNYYRKENEIGYILSQKWFSSWEDMVYISDF